MNKKIRTFIAFIIIIASANSAYPVSPPDGIRGVTETYGPWLQKLIDNSPLKFLFPKESMSAYQEYQKLLFIAERLIEANEADQARSYLKRAGYLLNDPIEFGIVGRAKAVITILNFEIFHSGAKAASPFNKQACA